MAARGSHVVVLMLVFQQKLQRSDIYVWDPQLSNWHVKLKGDVRLILTCPCHELTHDHSGMTSRGNDADIDHIGSGNECHYVKKIPKDEQTLTDNL
jgi:hypothetical protein